MDTKRAQLLTAAVLLLGTVVVGAATHGGAAAPAPPIPATPSGKTSFSATGAGPVSFSGTLDRTAVLLGKDGLARIELALGAAADETARRIRRPTDVVIIFDRSGSMSGDKLVHARAAVRELLGQLSPGDRFSLVTYSDESRIAIPLQPLDDASRARWLATIGDIQADGGTNMSSGMDAALELVERSRTDGRVPHVILISDGLANQGDATPDGLVRRAKRAARGEYMLSSVGVGSDFNEYLMTALADAGTGNYYFVNDPRELSNVFAREFDAARTTVASGLAVQIEPAPGVQVIDAAGYPLEHSGSAVVFRPGSLFAGQQRRVWVTVSVPQQALGDYDIGRFSLSYGAPEHRTVLSFSETPRVACVSDPAQFYANVDSDAWSRSVIVDSYNKMQEEVAREVKAGNREGAVQRLADFRDQTATMNAHVQSAPVAAQLDSVDRLEADVVGAFQGPDQAQRQNEFSKKRSIGAIDSRRAGAKK